MIRTTTTAPTKKGGAQTMKTDSYHEHSIQQYGAHSGCQHFLEGALERLAQRIALQQQQQQGAVSDEPRQHIVDLGAADGANSMRTLQFAIHTLQQQLEQRQSTLPPLKITLEEHPDSDQAFLEQTISNHQNWLDQHGIQTQVLMKSFYEPLFPSNSVDLLLSYICLHWLDTAQESPAEWKSWAPPETHADFVFLNEATVPQPVQDQWRQALAQRHLAQFLALRARELKPGAEGVLMMAGAPNQFVCPSPHTPSTLTVALQNCVQRGTVREDILKKALIPYYTRTVQDIRDAMELAATIPFSSTGNEEMEYPGSFLSLVDVLAYPVLMGKGDTFQGTFEMAWSIHEGAIRSAGATDAELEAIRLETQKLWAETYHPEQGIEMTYVACVIRRKTRKAWS
jgi:SAM dependent carboxyl methyltransferase